MIERPLRFAGYSTKQKVKRESSGKEFLTNVKRYRRTTSDVIRINND